MISNTQPRFNSFLFIYMCSLCVCVCVRVCACVCVCMCLCLFMCIHACGGQRLMLVSSLISLCLTFKTGSLTESCAHRLPVTICPSLLPLGWSIDMHKHTPIFLCECWGYRYRKAAFNFNQVKIT